MISKNKVTKPPRSSDNSAAEHDQNKNTNTGGSYQAELVRDHAKKLIQFRYTDAGEAGEPSEANEPTESIQISEIDQVSQYNNNAEEATQADEIIEKNRASEATTSVVEATQYQTQIQISNAATSTHDIQIDNNVHHDSNDNETADGSQLVIDAPASYNTPDDVTGHENRRTKRCKTQTPHNTAPANKAAMDEFVRVMNAIEFRPGEENIFRHLLGYIETTIWKDVKEKKGSVLPLTSDRVEAAISALDSLSRFTSADAPPEDHQGIYDDLLSLCQLARGSCVLQINAHGHARVVKDITKLSNVDTVWMLGLAWLRFRYCEESTRAEGESLVDDTENTLLLLTRAMKCDGTALSRRTLRDLSDSRPSIESDTPLDDRDDGDQEAPTPEALTSEPATRKDAKRHIRTMNATDIITDMTIGNPSNTRASAPDRDKKRKHRGVSPHSLLTTYSNPKSEGEMQDEDQDEVDINPPSKRQRKSRRLSNKDQGLGVAPQRQAIAGLSGNTAQKEGTAGRGKRGKIKKQDPALGTPQAVKRARRSEDTAETSLSVVTASEMMRGPESPNRSVDPAASPNDQTAEGIQASRERDSRATSVPPDSKRMEIGIAAPFRTSTVADAQVIPTAPAAAAGTISRPLGQGASARMRRNHERASRLDGDEHGQDPEEPCRQCSSASRRCRVEKDRGGHGRPTCGACILYHLKCSFCSPTVRR